MINLMISTNPRGHGGIATVVTGYQEQKLIDDFSFKVIHTHSSTHKTKLFAALQFFYALILITFYGLFNRLGIAHIHMASRGSYFRKSIIIRLVKFFGAKTILHLHGAEFEKFYSSECSENKKQHIIRSFNIADKVVVLSSQWLKWVNTIVADKSKVCIVYNAVPELKLTKTISEQQKILFLGRLGRRKGVDDLINSFALICKEFPKAQLKLGGDGDIKKYQDQVKQLNIIDQVEFLGWIEGKTKTSYLASATLYCLPSYNEGFPMGVLEAMSAEVTVIASTVGGIPDAIENNKEGVLIEAGNVEALADALRELLADNVKRNQFASAAKVKFKNNFSHDVIIPQLKGIYEELLAADK